MTQGPLPMLCGEPQVCGIKQVDMASEVFAGHQSESVWARVLLRVCVCACKPLIMRAQLRIKKVNKVMSLQQKSVTYNGALALLDYHNHHTLVPKPVTQLLCSQRFQRQYKRSAGGRLREFNNYLLVLPI